VVVVVVAVVVVTLLVVAVVVVTLLVVVGREVVTAVLVVDDGPSDAAGRQPARTADNTRTATAPSSPRQAARGQEEEDRATAEKARHPIESRGIAGPGPLACTIRP